MQRFVAQQRRTESARDQMGMEEAKATLAMAYGMIEHQLGEHLGQGFTMADCAAAPALFYASAVLPFPADHQKLIRYADWLMARPSVRRSIEGAKPYLHFFPLAAL